MGNNQAFACVLSVYRDLFFGVIRISEYLASIPTPSPSSAFWYPNPDNGDVDLVPETSVYLKYLQGYQPEEILLNL